MQEAMDCNREISIM